MTNKNKQNKAKNKLIIKDNKQVEGIEIEFKYTSTH